MYFQCQRLQEKTRIRRILFLTLLGFFSPQNFPPGKGNLANVPQSENVEEYFKFLKYECKYHFFCLTSTLTNQILNQEPGFSFRTGKIGITGRFSPRLPGYVALLFSPQSRSRLFLPSLSCFAVPLSWEFCPGQPSHEFFLGVGGSSSGQTLQKCFFAGFGCDQ